MPDIYELYHTYLLARLRKTPGDTKLKRLVAEHQRYGERVMTDALAKVAEDIETVTARLARTTDELVGKSYDQIRAEMDVGIVLDGPVTRRIVGDEGSYDSRADIEAASNRALEVSRAALVGKLAIVEREIRRRSRAAE